MCDPVSITLATLQVAQTVSSLKGQMDTAKAQEKFNNKQRDQALIAMGENNNQINLAQEQQRQQAMSQVEQNNKAARDALSTAQVSAGENGVSGLSVDALMGDILGQQSMFNESVKQNYMGQVMANETSRRNVHTDASNLVNSLQPVAAPDYLGAALRIGQAGVQGYGAYGDYIRSGTSATTSTDTNYSIPTKRY